jgi:hypothetical protein
MSVHVFVGPTLPASIVLALIPTAVLHAPVAHGDLLRLRLTRQDIVVLVDGYYHHSAPVRHKEILVLLREGVSVIGCASMGALRAAELSAFGMIGRGTVFEMYRDGAIDADDEVAVTHGPAPDYRTFTVPMVALRHAARSARLAGALSAGQERLVVELAGAIHYTERSEVALRSAAAAHSEHAAGAIARLKAFVADHPDAGNVKATDAVDTLRRVSLGELVERQEPQDWQVSSDWRNRYLDEWLAEFSVTRVDKLAVSRSATVRYQQIYLDEFPLRWQRFVLRHIVGGDVGDNAGDDELVRAAMAIAAQHGLTAWSLTAEHTRYWLTAAEMAGMSERDVLVRILARSYQPLAPTRYLADADPTLVLDPQALRAVAEAEVINAEVASWLPRNSIDHLKFPVLREHLAQVWRVDSADDAALLAAARDRGFGTVSDAVTAVRPFFLRSRFLVGTTSPSTAETG